MLTIICPVLRSSWNFADISKNTDHAEQWNSYGLVQKRKGLLGSRNYIKEHETELPAHRFNMNVDLAGQLVGGTVVGVTGDASICNMITYMAHETGIGMSTKNQIWGSDSNTFAWKGIPAMTLNRDGFRHAYTS